MVFAALKFLTFSQMAENGLDQCSVYGVAEAPGSC